MFCHVTSFHFTKNMFNMFLTWKSKIALEHSYYFLHLQKKKKKKNTLRCVFYLLSCIFTQITAHYYYSLVFAMWSSLSNWVTIFHSTFIWLSAFIVILGACFVFYLHFGFFLYFLPHFIWSKIVQACTSTTTTKFEVFFIIPTFTITYI